MGLWLSRVASGVFWLWWVSVAWLVFTAAIIIYCFVFWLASKDPSRHEIATAAALVLIYAAPAGLSVIAAGVFPRTGLSAYKRVGGIALFLFCIGAMMLLDYLQARYR